VPASGVVIVILPVVVAALLQSNSRAHVPHVEVEPHAGGAPDGSGALAADQFPVPFNGKLTPVMHEETPGAAELVGRLALKIPVPLVFYESLKVHQTLQKPECSSKRKILISS
jgi:hypothetical protein